jgi:phosphohistidine phosphatase SixA
MRNCHPIRSAFQEIALSLLLLVAFSVVRSESLSGPDLVTALRAGGYVILMRHASSPPRPPDTAHTDAENVQHERQLDELGRSSARAMGEALHRLHIPIGAALSSPAYRALETVRLAKLGQPVTFTELGDGGQDSGAGQDSARTRWLRARAATVPAPHENTVIVTHYPNILEAYAERAEGLAEGEALILHPDGRGGTDVIARVKVDEWGSLASSR